MMQPYLTGFPENSNRIFIQGSSVGVSVNTMENDIAKPIQRNDSATAKKSLLDGWNAPPNLVTYFAHRAWS